MKKKVFEKFDTYIEQRFEKMGSDYTIPTPLDIIDSADEEFMGYYKDKEEEIDSMWAEALTKSAEQFMYDAYMTNRHDELIQHLKEVNADKRYKHQTEESLMPGKI